MKSVCNNIFNRKIIFVNKCESWHNIYIYIYEGNKYLKRLTFYTINEFYCYFNFETQKITNKSFY